MDVSKPISASISSISFSYLTSADVRRISVKQVTNPDLFDNLNQPTAGGLYDPVFGPLDRGSICATCRLSSYDCPGHFGHIELPAPVFHPLYMRQAYQLLRGTCTYCHHFLTSRASILKYIAQLTLLEHGLVSQSDAVQFLTLRVAAKRSRSSKKNGDGEEMMEDDGEAGESTEESETLEQYEVRLGTWVSVCLARARAGAVGDDMGRDEYKNSAIVYDKRKKVMHEFLKSLTKKKCERCGAYSHRFRKEGHVKLIEYSLVAKQRLVHRSNGIRRPNVLLLQAIASRSEAARKEANAGLEDGEEAVRAANRNGKGRGSDEDESDEDNDNDDDDSESNSSGGEGDGDGAGSDLDMADVDVEEQAAETIQKNRRQAERIIPPDEVRAHLRRLFKNELPILSLLYAPHGPRATSLLAAAASSSDSPFAPSAASSSKIGPSLPRASADIFFLDVISVPPTRFRPAASLGDILFENPQNSLLNSILKQTFAVRDLNVALAVANAVVDHKQAAKDAEAAGLRAPLELTRVYTMLLESLIQLQVTVNSMIDSTKNPVVLGGGKLPPMGVKQMLEKKDGLFRKNMMGKRVNYAARSVISPDVNIETNEIGVPPIFARKLTFPEPVTAHNIALMRQLVINGPLVHPGASFIQMEDGNLISLDRMSIEERTAQANKLMAPDSRLASSRLDRPDVGFPQTRTPQVNRKVYRHLTDGDIVILNRQPTLHKPSMMCHRVKVLNGEKTIRMHYANCNSYNADFDGDEMNMHFPQSLVAQAEARLIANTDNQYLVPTSGNPLRGLIQDHVVAGVWLTNKDTFFSREDYYQLIYGALRTEDDYTGGGKILTLPPAILKPTPLWTGKQVISTLMKNITPEGCNGLFLTCKAKVPGSAWGIHSIEETVQFVDGELLTGILDKAQIGASPYGLVHSVFELYGPEVAGKLLSILSRVLTKFLQSRAFTCRMDDLLLTDKGNSDRRAMLATVNSKGLDAALDYVGLGDADKTKAETATDLRVRLEEILRDDYKLAGLDATVEGETNQVTTNLIKTCLPSGLVKPFPHNNMQTMTVSGAKGSNVNASQISCLLGQQSLEGRRVPTMVSGKTLPSFKAFETAPRAGGFVAGRFLTGIRPQEYYFHCMAGREGLIDTAVKTSRSGYLQRCLIKHLEGLRVQYDHTVRNSDKSILQFHYGEDSLDVTKQKHLMQFEFAVRNTQSLVQRYRPKDIMGKVNDIGSDYSKKSLKHPSIYPPGLSLNSPSTNLGCVSETYAAAVEKYIATNPHRLIRTKKKHRTDWPAFIKTDELVSVEHFRSLMNVRYMRSLVEPGESVGLIAAQGVGEPSTQMTLNTFHFAGHGAANVTLGIPRLREIVMTASKKIKTPTMQLPILESVHADALKNFCQDTSRLNLSQIVDEVTVRERLSSKTASNNHSRQKLYTIRLQFYPKSDYAAEHNITSEAILLGLQRTFVPSLDRAILKQIKQNDKEAKSQVGDMGKARKVSAATTAKSRAQDGDAVEAEDSEEINEAEEGEGDEELRESAQAKQKADLESDGSDEESDDDDDVAAAGGKSDEDDGGFAKAFPDSGSEVGDDDSEDEATPEMLAKAAKLDALSNMKRIERKTAGMSRYIDKVTFDKVKGEWCEFDLEFSSRAHKLLLVGIVETCCRSAIIHEISGISRCFVAKPKNSSVTERTAMTEGVNLRGCWTFGYGIVDLDRFTTNEIGDTLKTYGVEAARTSIIQEMGGIFGAYGIGVDPRHLTVISDYMTCEGGYKPFNRTGLANNTSTFLKASFETTSGFIAEAALHGDFDDLGTPSANIVLGKIPKGVFDLLTACEA